MIIWGCCWWRFVRLRIVGYGGVLALIEAVLWIAPPNCLLFGPGLLFLLLGLGERGGVGGFAPLLLSSPFLFIL